MANDLIVNATASNCDVPQKKPGALQDCRKETVTGNSICWASDYELEINSLLIGRYTHRYDATGTIIGLESTRFVKYKLYVPLRGGSDIIVEVRFMVEGALDINNGFKQLPMEKALTMKSVVEEGVSQYWNNRFKLAISDPRCGKKILAIRYKPVWVEKNYHYKLVVSTALEREGVSNGIMDICLTSTPWTVAHEFAHCLGLPDEYATDPDTKSLRYIKPDGTLDISIITPEDKNSDATDATIMSSRDNQIRLARHAWNIAIETRDLLTREIGRDIKCDIA